MFVKDIMSKDIVSLSPDEPVSKFISLMEQLHIHEVLIVDDAKRLLGVVDYKSLVTTGITDPTSIQLKKLMQPLPQLVSPEDDMSDAADLIFKTGLRAVPVVKNKKVVGIASVFDIINNIIKTKQFRQTYAEALMSSVLTVTKDDDIGKARVLIRERNLSRLPVVNSDGKLVGAVAVFDLLKAIKPRERMGWYSMVAEKKRIMGIAVSTVMNRNPVTAARSASLNEIGNLMAKYKTSGIIITDDSKPVGIITLKDLLEVYIAGMQQKGVYYQIIGIENEDEFVLDTVDRMIRDTIQKLSFIYPPQFFFVHVKKYQKEGAVMKYSVRTRLKTDRGVFISRGCKWDLRDAVGDALDHLERAMLKWKGVVTTKTKRNIQKLKQI